MSNVVHGFMRGGTRETACGATTENKKVATGNSKSSIITCRKCLKNLRRWEQK